MGDDDDDDDDDSVFQSSTQIETSSSLDETTTAKVTKKVCDSFRIFFCISHFRFNDCLINQI